MIINSGNIKQLLGAVTQTFRENRDELCALDRAIGDGDHGDSMARGADAGQQAIDALPADAQVYDCIKAYSRAMLATIGGAIGPIFSTVFSELGKASRESGKIDSPEYALGLENAAKKVMDLGGAAPGDKTLVDALVPAADAAEINREKPLAECAAAVSSAAKKGAESTIEMQAKMGRSHFLREKSIGHQDAGATSLYLVLETIAKFVA